MSVFSLTSLWRNISSLLALFIIGAVGVVCVAAVVLSLTQNLSGAIRKPDGSIQRVTLPERASQGLFVPKGGNNPARLKIPVIHVDAAVEYVGYASNGSMDVPKGPNDVAWFKLGPRPGEKGSAVLAGHEGWKNGISAVFDNLRKLQKGDRVYVQDNAGAVTAFVVKEVRTYDEHDDAWRVFLSNDGRARLNLVTCEGIWNKVTRSYSNRFVVFTEKE